jgi:DNA-binding IclR family transcriptional regulator
MRPKSYPSAVAVERAVDLLYLLAERGDTSLAALAQEMGSSRSAIRRILTALRRKGLIEQDPVSDLYSLSWLDRTLAKARQDRVGLREVALQPMTELRDLTEETVTLNVRSAFQRVCIEQVEGLQEVRWQGEIGRIDVPEEELDRYLSRVARRQLTPNTLLDGDELRRELEEVRRRGYATGRQDRVIGVAGVSAPIFNESGAAFASITVASPSERGTPDQLEAWAPDVLRAASRLSELLGGWPTPP